MVIWLLCVCLFGCCVLIIWLLCADCSASALTACGYPVAVRVINGWCVCVCEYLVAVRVGFWLLCVVIRS